MHLIVVAAIATFSSFVAATARADHHQVCGADFPAGVDCYLYALSYTYRMCHHVQTIAVIEYGMKEANAGVNGKKYEFCVDKQRKQLAGPMRLALRQAGANAEAKRRIQAMRDDWERSLADLPPRPDEEIDAYNTRITTPYVVFAEQGAELQEIAARPPRASTAPAVRAVPERAERKRPAKRNRAQGSSRAASSS